MRLLECGESVLHRLLRGFLHKLLQRSLHGGLNRALNRRLHGGLRDFCYRLFDGVVYSGANVRFYLLARGPYFLRNRSCRVALHCAPQVLLRFREQPRHLARDGHRVLSLRRPGQHS